MFINVITIGLINLDMNKTEKLQEIAILTHFTVSSGKASWRSQNISNIN